MPPSNLPEQRVFIVGDGSLFEEGIMRLLSFETELLVSLVIYTDDSALLDLIAQDQPDIILLNESALLDTAGVLWWLHSYPSVDRLRVIVVRLSSDVVDVYETSEQFVVRRGSGRQQFIPKNQDELLDVVRGDGYRI